MLKTLRDLFETLRPRAPRGRPEAEEHALQLATAVMLVEVMRADTSFDAERARGRAPALGEKFQFADDEAARLAELAEADRQGRDRSLRVHLAHQRALRHGAKIRMIESCGRWPTPTAG